MNSSSNENPLDSMTGLTMLFGTILCECSLKDCQFKPQLVIPKWALLNDFGQKSFHLKNYSVGCIPQEAL